LGAASALVLGAAYTLWMVKRVVFGAVANPTVAQLTDLTSRETVVLTLLALAVLGMGVYPKPFTDIIDPSVAELLMHVAKGKLL
jgi:NADH-quinone oxidoreductase subunit M